MLILPSQLSNSYGSWAYWWERIIYGCLFTLVEGWAYPRKNTVMLFEDWHDYDFINELELKKKMKNLIFLTLNLCCFHFVDYENRSKKLVKRKATVNRTMCSPQGNSSCLQLTLYWQLVIIQSNQMFCPAIILHIC